MRMLAAIALIFATTVAAQGTAKMATIKGAVLTDSTERPIAGATVAIEMLKLSATTDSLGRYSMSGIPAGVHMLSVRRIGFEPVATRVSFGVGAAVEADLLLTPNAAQTLPGVKVETSAPVRAKLQEFEERRLAGQGGRFLTQADLEKRPYASFTDALRQLPGFEAYRSPIKGNEWYAVVGRMAMPGGAMASGPRIPPPCYAAVMLDGAMVYGAGGG